MIDGVFVGQNVTYNLLDGAKNLVDDTKGSLVLQEDGGIEFGDSIVIDHLEHHVVLRSVYVGSIL